MSESKWVRVDQKWHLRKRKESSVGSSRKKFLKKIPLSVACMISGESDSLSAPAWNEPCRAARSVRPTYPPYIYPTNVQGTFNISNFFANSLDDLFLKNDHFPCNTCEVNLIFQEQTMHVIFLRGKMHHFANIWCIRLALWKKDIFCDHFVHRILCKGNFTFSVFVHRVFSTREIANFPNKLWMGFFLGPKKIRVSEKSLWNLGFEPGTHYEQLSVFVHRKFCNNSYAHLLLVSP